MGPGLYSEISPLRIRINEPSKTMSQRITPSNKGAWPTCFTVAIEIPLPKVEGDGQADLRKLAQVPYSA